MSDDSNETTNTDTAILADFRRRCEAELRGGGIDRGWGRSWGRARRQQRARVRERRCRGRLPPQQVAEADAVR